MNLNRTFITSALLLSGVYGVTAAETSRYRFPQFATLQRCLSQGRGSNKSLKKAAQYWAGKEATLAQLEAYAQGAKPFILPFTDEGAAEEMVERLTTSGTLIREEEKTK